PVKDILNIATDKPVHSIRIYNVYGTEVAYATDTNSIDVSHLPAGVYMVRADGKVARIIKE
ncbi:MAG: T9SS type A sorting domain-containing protein, partial [Bacteroidota bacterium]